MKNNKLFVSAAGSGKTTYIVNKALELDKSHQILITTYTIENEEEIRKKILAKRKSIPSNIKIQGWFSFLLQHGVKPYQGAMNDVLFENSIKGMFLIEGKSAPKFDGNGRPLFLRGGARQYYGEVDFEKFYFTQNWQIYSDKISKFVVGCNLKTKGEIISRISRIYSHVFIDEVQDLAGFDLEIIKLLFKSTTETILVGDPRQVTYKTNHYRKYPKYKDGKVKEFVQNECKCSIDENTIDEETLKVSHRNNKAICDYSSKLYDGKYELSTACDCERCRNHGVKHEGVFLVRKGELKGYLDLYNPVQLRYNKAEECDKNYPIMNFGQSKGKTFSHVVIYPTNDILDWIKDNAKDLKPTTKSRFYVALTRARHSVAIVYDYLDNDNIPGTIKFKPE